jgi:hypothetical protein
MTLNIATDIDMYKDIDPVMDLDMGMDTNIDTNTSHGHEHLNLGSHHEANFEIGF